MISQPLPPELGQFVEQQLALGKYQSEQELVVDAVRVLREVEIQQFQFHNDVRLGIEQLERGQVNEYSLDQLCMRFEQLKMRVRRRCSDGKDGE
jgi:Arc/MetJ-type ribon-helix-helix transcriptional regulator